METIKKEAQAAKTDTSVPMVAQEQQLPQEHLDIDLWIKTRAEFKTKVGSIMLQGSDYHVIQDRKSLAKGGAEKIASIFGWSAEFVMDQETLMMIGEPKGILAYVCDLKDRTGRIVGQGRGAASLTKNANDVNKAVKMAQKSAFIDAVLRASGLSDIYTQDLEDIPADQVSKPSNTTFKQNVPYTNTARPASDKQKALIKDLMTQKGLTREDLISEGFGAKSNPSEIIDFLFGYKKPVETDSVIDILNQEGIGANL
jgi:antitoxin component HigA of HigAB toxin-antitoxin module